MCHLYQFLSFSVFAAAYIGHVPLEREALKALNRFYQLKEGYIDKNKMQGEGGR